VTGLDAPTPRVGVIVLNWCGEDDTVSCVESLLASQYPGIEIVIVDNGSPDGSGLRLAQRFPAVDFLQTGSNQGYAGGNNRGIEHMLEKGVDYIIVLNNDTVVEERCIEHLVKSARDNPMAGAISPEIRYFGAPERVWFSGGSFDPLRALGMHDTPDPESRVSNDSTFLSGCCLLFPAQVLRELGGFDEAFFAYAEDVDMSLRIRRSGRSLLVCREAIVLHRVSTSDRHPAPYQIELRDRNRRRVARRWLDPLQRIRFFVFFYTTRMGLLLRYCASGDLSRARALIGGALR